VAQSLKHPTLEGSNLLKREEIFYSEKQGTSISLGSGHDPEITT